MTPEEERQMQMQIQAILSNGMTPGMSSPSGPSPSREAAQARASLSTGGMESRLKSQQAYANQLRGREMPKGRNVGPLGVYMAPNWGEALAGAMNPVIGGLMSRGMEDDYAALDTVTSDRAKAAAELEQMDLKDARAYSTGERVGGQDFQMGKQIQGQGFTADQNAINNAFRGLENAAGRGVTRRGQDMSSETAEAGRGVTERGQDMSAGTAAASLLERSVNNEARLAFDEGKGKTKTYVGPDGPLTVIEDVQGVSWQTDANGNIDTPIDVSGMKELVEARQVNLTKAEMEALDAQSKGADNATFGITMASDIFRAPNDIWNDGTGLGAESLFTGTTGFASGTEAGPKIQEFQRKVQKLGFEGMKDDFERLNLGQIAKNEFEAVSKANANWKTEPYGLVMLQAGKIPMYEEAFNEGIKAGSHTKPQRDVHMQKMEDDVIFGATQIDQKTGKPTVNLAELERKGIDVIGRRAELAEKLTSGTANQEDKALLTAIIMARKAEKADS